MDTVLVLIASPSKITLTSEIISSILTHLPQTRTINWLAPNMVAEISFTAPPGFNKQKLEPEIRDSLNGAAIDLAFMPATRHNFKILIADMDSTMIGQECIDELGNAAGFGKEISLITTRAMAGELDFEAALQERVKMLRGLDVALIDEVIKTRITFTPGGKQLIATMRAHGAYTALISGGFNQFTHHVAQKLGFAEHQANELVIENGKLTGEVALPILGRDAKVTAVKRLCATHDLSLAQAMTVGDGANDAGMIELAGLGVALHAKETLRQVADIRIDHNDLTALLYLQGFSQDQFVS